jgi:hypothetical protein
MTLLFQEYEQKRLAKENANSLIGKEFYWSKTRYTNQIRAYNDYNLFKITNISTNCRGIDVEYRYLHRDDDYEYEYAKSFEYFLEHSSPYYPEEVQ